MVVKATGGSWKDARKRRTFSVSVALTGNFVRILPILPFLLFSIFPVHAQSAEKKPVAIISHLEGKILIKRDGKEMPAQLGIACYEKDEVRAVAGLTVLYFLTGKIRQVAAPSSFLITEEIVRSLGNISSPQSDLVRRNEELFSGKSRQTAIAEPATGGLRGSPGAGSVARLLYPMRTILSPQPTFQWTYGKEVPTEELVLVIEDEDAKVISQKKIGLDQRSLACPLSLARGKAYTWYIKTGSQNLEDVESILNFAIASEQKAKEYLQLKQSLQNEAADEATQHLVLAKHAERLDFLTEAVEHWKRVSKLHPGQTLPHSSLMGLYRILGMKEEYEKEKMLLEGSGEK